MFKARSALLLVILQLAVFLVLYATVIRPWHLRWGATDAELSRALPGDSYVPRFAIVTTRAITIDAKPEDVWPWLLQLGQGRGGFYSYDWLENLFAADMHNANMIMPESQRLKVGDHISFQRNGPYTTVAYIDPGRTLVAEGGWTWHLEPLGEKSTRLIVRYASFEVTDAVTSLFYYAVFEPAHYVMESGMMLGIEVRAEENALRNLVAPTTMRE